MIGRMKNVNVCIPLISHVDIFQVAFSVHTIVDCVVLYPGSHDTVASAPNVVFNGFFNVAFPCDKGGRLPQSEP